MLYVATGVEFGTVGTLLALSGGIEECQQLGFAERPGNEEFGMLRGIAYHVAPSFGSARARR